MPSDSSSIAENTRVSEITRLGQAHGQPGPALDAIRKGTSAAAFREWVAQAAAAKIRGSARPEILSNRNYDFARSAMALAQRRLPDGFEGEVHQEMTRLHGAAAHGGTLVP